ncbi:MAG: RsmB/NOP family class I SAM-dependent RNA methyltransferase [Proteobacteria bacterium]|nr:RsmB/NOP family class I SAM-dependent RNA methyltransferase [Pseudomonadota bacterium]
MTPAARAAACIDILGELDTASRPVDTQIRDYFRSRRYAGSGDRRAIRDQVYDILRHQARLDWWCTRFSMPPSPRARVIAAHLLIRNEAADRVQQLFSGGGYGPSALTEAEQAFAAEITGKAINASTMPPSVIHEFPAWLEPDLVERFGDNLDTEMEALNRPASLDLRVNTLKADCRRAIILLANEHIDAEATPLSPIGLRVQGHPNLEKTTAFQGGFIEVQDEGSQLIALLCDARPGQTVLDICAGGGGKTLALAATQQDDGILIAADADAKRLANLEKRTRRAGARSIQQSNDLTAYTAKADRVLIDAPCSGVGVWRRQPGARWRLTAESLAGYVAQQREILENAAPLVRPGGRLIYATCSLLAVENAGQIERFLGSHPEFSVLPIDDIWAKTIDGTCPVVGPYLELTPARHGTDGFFAAVLKRSDEMEPS